MYVRPEYFWIEVQVQHGLTVQVSPRHGNALAAIRQWGSIRSAAIQVTVDGQRLLWAPVSDRLWIVSIWSTQVVSGCQCFGQGWGCASEVLLEATSSGRSHRPGRVANHGIQTSTSGGVIITWKSQWNVRCYCFFSQVNQIMYEIFLFSMVFLVRMYTLAAKILS